MKTQAQTKKSKRNYIIVALIVVLLLLGVGYAAFSETLTISGTVSGDMTWNVVFDESSTGVIGKDGHELTVTTDLNYPGDAKEVTAVIKNNSTVPIKLKSFNLTEPTEDDITIDYVNLTGTDEKLGIGATCTYKFIVKWDESSEKTTVNDTYTFTFDYEQDTTSPELESSHSNK